MIKKYNKKNGKIVEILENDFTQVNEDSNVVVNVLYCGICGTDYQKYIGMDNVEEWGHEIIGKVVDDKLDDCIVTIRTTYPCEMCENCKMGFSERCNNWKRLNFTGFSNKIMVNKKSIIPINEKDVDIVYTLVEPLYVANSLIKHVMPNSNSVYSVVGNGTIGLLVAFLIRKKYGSEVRIIGRRNLPNRDSFIKKIGANYYKYSNMEVALRESNKIIVTTPYNTIPEIIKFADKYSNITFNGISKENSVKLDFADWHFKNINVWPSFPHPQNDFSEEIQIIKENKLLLRDIITNIFPLEKIEDAFKLLNDKTKDCIKILINCEEEQI